jgi:hypothetical protein
LQQAFQTFVQFVAAQMLRNFSPAELKQGCQPKTCSLCHKPVHITHHQQNHSKIIIIPTRLIAQIFRLGNSKDPSPQLVIQAGATRRKKEKPIERQTHTRGV